MANDNYLIYTAEFSGGFTLQQKNRIDVGIPGYSASFIMQNDGNLVVYGNNGQAVWSSRTYGQNCSAGRCHMLMQSDGNLVVYNNAALWSSGTSGHPGAHLVILTAQPYLKIVDSAGVTIWNP